MAKLDTLLANKQLKHFLTNYPKDQWLPCLEAVLVYGLDTLERKYPFGLSLDQLSKVAGITEFASLKEPKTKRTVKQKTTTRVSKSTNKHRPEAHPPPTKENKRVSTSPGLRDISNMMASPKGYYSRDIVVPKINEEMIRKLRSSVSSAQLWQPSATTESNQILKIAEGFLRQPFTMSIFNRERK